MLPVLAWEGGGDAMLISLTDETAVLRSTKPFAPGSRPTGVLPNGAGIRLKTHRSRREELADGKTFTIDGRILDLTRELRSLLTSALSEPTERAAEPTEKADSSQADSNQ